MRESIGLALDFTEKCFMVYVVCRAAVSPCAPTFLRVRSGVRLRRKGRAGVARVCAKGWKSYRFCHYRQPATVLITNRRGNEAYNIHSVIGIGSQGDLNC